MSLASKIHLRSEERMVIVIRRHGLVYGWKYLLGLGMLFASAFFASWLLAQNWWGQMLLVVGLVVGLLVIFLVWFFNYTNVLVVTDERVVDIVRPGLFEEYLTTIGFFDIKDIFVSRRGVLSTLFGCGRVTIATKSGELMIETDIIARPQSVVNTILETRDDYRQKRRVGTNEAIYKNFIKIIPELSEEELCEVKDLVDVRLSGFGGSH
ncbi:MAG: hypothetical protein WCX97_01515 [Candidatus Magasanikbacteria bacterium]